MLGLLPEQAESVLRRLDFLCVEVGDIPSFAGLTQSEYMRDRDRRRSLERLAENVVNAMIDISKIMLSATRLPIPDTYREVVLNLAAGILDASLSERLAELVRLRNILAHQYLDNRWTALRGFINEAPAILQQFVTVVKGLLSDS